MSGSKYKPVPLTILPVPSTQLSMTYIWRETQKAQVEGLSIRAKLIVLYLPQYNGSKHQMHNTDPVLIDWTYAGSTNVYPNFRTIPKNLLIF